MKAMHCQSVEVPAGGWPSAMAREIAEAAEVCACQLENNAWLMRDTGARLRALDAPFAATLARGSSDHAAAFAKWLFELVCGTPVLSHAPSIGALYHRTSQRFAGIPLIAISQSGRSPDLIAAAAAIQARGGLAIGFVNDLGSPLAALSNIVIPLHAGPELGVAATKTFVASLTALLHLAAEWAADEPLRAALCTLPVLLANARRCDWSAALPLLDGARNVLVLGRGYTLPIAAEAALKLKEVVGIEAEAFSTAEVAHGPMTLIGSGSLVFVFAPIDAARPGVKARIDDFAARGARVIGCGEPHDFTAAALHLELPDASHPALAATAAILQFYTLCEALARRRGRDPDAPPFLSKVTRTL